MPPLLENPFDPDEYGEAFAVALVPLCDPGSEIDLEIDKASAECVVTMGGVNYRVTIAAEHVCTPN
ncbi:hypothetical protein KRR38_12345 [Novosphingobium sp. G106]|uniref:hypothetical protein n=1 Tax=Novosphingobium sp. G106 TaxID=2849500 RepID=UPI001C2D47AD|nr:hypothetical protein [Novosphingobium sp. G106]MBV1688442.1 hypothetical protein [Novosphingobium sp. G106]